MFFENVTVKPVPANVSETVAVLVDQIQQRKQQNQPTAALEQEIDDLLADLYGMSATDRVTIDDREKA